MATAAFRPLSLVEDLAGGARPFLVATLFTRDYAAKCERLRASCRQFGLPFAACELEAVHVSISERGRDDPAATKPALINWALDRYQRPVLYIDCDCRVRSDPVLIDAIAADGYDFAAYNWLADECTDGFSPIAVGVGADLVQDRFYKLSVAIDHYATDQLIVSGAVQFYAPTAAAQGLLTRWQEAIVSLPGTLDDGCLAYAFNNGSNAGLQPYWLPKSYARYPWWITERPVIEHPDFPSARDDSQAWQAIKARSGKDRVYLERTVRRPPPRPCPADYVIDALTRQIYCVDQAGRLISAGRSVEALWLADAPA